MPAFNSNRSAKSGNSRRMNALAIAVSIGALAFVLAGCSKDSADNAPTTTPPATTIARPANAPNNPPAPATPATGGSSATGK